MTANFAAVVRSAAPASSPASAGGSVAAAQRAVERAQQNADAALSTADGHLASAAAACSTTQPQGWAGALGYTASDPTGSTAATATAAPTASPTSAPTAAPTASPTKPGVDVTACLAALKKVQSDQTATQAAQRSVSTAQAALTKALATSAASVGSGGSGSQPSGGSASGGSSRAPSGGSTSGRPSSGASPSGGARPGAPSPGSSPGSSRSGGAPSGGSTAGGSRTGAVPSGAVPSGGVPSGGVPSGGTGSAGASSGSAGGGRTITPEQITADEAAVTAAAAQVKVAQQDLDQATLRSPIAGTVAAVDLKTGDQVSANSTTATVQIVGAGAHQVSVGVDVTKIQSIKVGQTASVQPDGGAAALTAKVTAVGVAPTTGGGTIYPVTLAFTGTPRGLRGGISAAVTITTAQAASALAVPTSAVTRAVAGAFVTVLAGDRTTRTRVELGAVGSDYTQITSGIGAGTAVVLADLSEAVPSSSTTSNTRFGGRTGTRFGGLGGTGGFGGTPPR